MRDNNYQTLESENIQLKEHIVDLTKRYIEAERFIMEAQDRTLFDRIFLLPSDINDFLKQRLKWYNF